MTLPAMQPTVTYASWAVRSAQSLCVAVFGLGILNWAGWASNTAALTSFAPSWVPMRPWTALLLALLACAIGLQLGERARGLRLLTGRVLAVLAALFAVIIFLEYTGLDVGDFDTVWFGDAVRESPLPFPGRPSQQTVIPVLCTALTALVLRRDGRVFQWTRLSLLSIGVFVPTAATAAYLLGARSSLSFANPVQIAPATWLGLVVLASALVLGRPDVPPASWFMSLPSRAAVANWLIVLVGFPALVQGARLLLRGVGADDYTAWVFASGFAGIAVGIGMLVVSQQGQRLLLERAALADELRAATRRYRLLAENASDLVVSASVDKGIDWVSPSVTQILGYTPDELLGRSALMLFHPDDMPLLDADRPKVLAGETTITRLRMCTITGESHWCEVNSRPIMDASGAFAGVVLAVRNVGDEMAAQQAFQHEVDFDGLTGLPRRQVALHRIEEILESGGTRGWALLCVGVNGLTQINQAYTYTIGDAVLKAVADRLVAAVGSHDRVARIAGDEFVLLEPDLVTTTGAASAAERILAAVRGPLQVGDLEIEISASVGIAMATDDDVEELLRDAMAAMRQAGLRGPSRWEFHDGNVAALTRTALQVQAELRTALAGSEIEAWFMPVVSLPTRELVGYETLTRWRRADGSIWAPDLFLEIAERSGLVLELDRVMFRATLAAAARADARLIFGYNVSAASLVSEAFPQWIREEFAASGIDPRRFTFEITETALFHVTPGIRHAMESITALGVAWWVDDFGTGFSSISHLRDLPIAGLKLDKSFTSDVAEPGSTATALADGLLGLARGLHIGAVAEGVETDAQEAVLVAQGWPLAQGWRYGRPAPATW